MAESTMVCRILPNDLILHMNQLHIVESKVLVHGVECFYQPGDWSAFTKDGTPVDLLSKDDFPKYELKIVNCIRGFRRVLVKPGTDLIVSPEIELMTYEMVDLLRSRAICTRISGNGPRSLVYPLNDGHIIDSMVISNYLELCDIPFPVEVLFGWFGGRYHLFGWPDGTFPWL